MLRAGALQSQGTIPIKGSQLPYVRAETGVGLVKLTVTETVAIIPKNTRNFLRKSFIYLHNSIISQKSQQNRGVNLDKNAYVCYNYGKPS